VRVIVRFNFCSLKLPRKPSRVDLITLDPPFPPDSDDPGRVEEPMANHDDFEDIWNSFDASVDLRGWCSASIDNVIRRLQCVEHYRLAVIAAEHPPFIGRLKPSIIGCKVLTFSDRRTKNYDDSRYGHYRPSDADTFAGDRGRLMFMEITMCR
jgi:hypothetical protein